MHYQTFFICILVIAKKGNIFVVPENNFKKGVHVINTRQFPTYFIAGTQQVRRGLSVLQHHTTGVQMVCSTFDIEDFTHKNV